MDISLSTVNAYAIKPVAVDASILHDSALAILLIRCSTISSAEVSIILALFYAFHP